MSEPTNGPPQFSFVVPAHNEERHLGPTLRSVLGQSFDRFEVLVVDDGSTDRTRDVAELSDAPGNLTLLRHPVSRGSGASRNTGLQHACGEVVVFLDADVTVPSDFLQQLANRYRPGVDGVAVESRVADQSTVVGRFFQAYHEVTHPAMKGVVFSQAFSCRREYALRLGFDEDLPSTAADDAEFATRLIQAGCRVVQAPEIVVDHALPTDLVGLWNHALKRGRAVAHFDLRVRRYRPSTVLARRAAASSVAAARILALVPELRYSASLAARRAAIPGDRVRFWALHHMFEFAYRFGQLSTAVRLLREAP